MNYNQAIMPPPYLLKDPKHLIEKVQGNIYICDKKYAVMPAILTVPINGVEDMFTFELWVKVVMDELTPILVEQKPDKIFTATLLSDIPFYGTGRGETVKASFNLKSGDFSKPILIPHSDLGQVSIDFQNGISKSTYQLWMDNIKVGKIGTSYI